MRSCSTDAFSVSPDAPSNVTKTIHAKTETQAILIYLSFIAPFPPVTVISKMIFDFATELPERGKFPFHIIIEEAHRYVQMDRDQQLLGYNIFDRITKEGRKYGVLLGLITQRPSELSDTSISQCSNFIILRTLHPKDLDYIKQMVPNVSDEIMAHLKTLQPGNAIAFGSAFKVPVDIKMDMPNPQPKSSSSNITKIWYGEN